MKRYTALLALSLAFSTTTSRADDKKEQAKALFNAGAQAYSVGQYVAAIDAFEEAYKLQPLPAIVFSLAQAERRQYFVDHKPDRLTKALDGFRKYIAEVTQGGRRGDAVAAIAELEPLADKAKTMPPPPPAEPVKQATRIMVTSPIPSAKVEVDGSSAGDAPYIGEVKAGKHTVVVKAKGYDDEKREVAVAEGGVIALDLEPRERPAFLNVKGPSGADISVDGRPVAVTPLASPLALSHGRHFVSVTKNGKLAFTREIAVVRGETSSVDVSLESSGQRYVAYGFLGAGVAAFVTGGVFVGLTLDRQHKAQSVLDTKDKSNIDPSQLGDYQAARADRDKYRTMSFVTFGAGAVLTTVGIVLFAFDRPSVTTPESSFEKKPAPQPKNTSPMEMVFAPSITPGFIGGTLVGAF